METLVEAEPEVMVLMPCGFDEPRTLKEWEPLRDLPAWQAVPAVANGRVFAVDGSRFFNRPGPGLVDGLEILADCIEAAGRPFLKSCSRDSCCCSPWSRWWSSTSSSR